MPKYRLKACVNWICNSDTNFGIEECESREQAEEWAWETALQFLETWVEEITEEDED